ncbi:hypothetical protein GGS24DRAFT_491591 [Hypoxylon argillaceum]|nr:hypothetical protein GGS24DRAFT_491591 [Hypoxylon argillaceum]
MATQLDDDSRRLLQLGENESLPPTKPLFDAQRTLLAPAGLLTELISEPQNRLLEVSSQYFEARALHMIVDKRVPDILARSGDRGIDEEDVFAHNRITVSLVNKKLLRAYIVLFGLDLYSSSNQLPRYLHDPNKGPLYETDKARWDWLEEEVSVDALQAGNNSSHGGSSAYPGVFGAELEKACGDSKAATLIKRPEHSIFGIAMAVGGRVFGQAHLYGMPITFQGIIKSELRELVDRAGLMLRKIWDCRSQVGFLEIVLPDSELD